MRRLRLTTGWKLSAVGVLGIASWEDPMHRVYSSTETACAHLVLASGGVCSRRPCFWLLAGLLFHLLGTNVAAQPVSGTPTTAQPFQLHQVCGLAGFGSDIVIPDDGNIYQITADANCGLITVQGTLKCADGAIAAVEADGIMISGPNANLICGTATNRFNGKLSFTIGNNRAFPNHPHHGERAVVVMNGGTLELHGQIAKARFSRLTQDALKGDTSMSVENAFGWEQDDQILVTTTSTYPDQTELLHLGDDCPGGTCAIAGAAVPPTGPLGLEYFHYGSGQQTYIGAGENGQDLTVDMRAFVANVQRNIKVRGANDSYWVSEDPKGAHLMIMPGAAAYVDAVEFNRMGQQMILARYPFHWHHAGSVAGQYIRNSTIRNSASRCVTLHNTQQAEVSNNLCLNVRGHAIFLENGNEIENLITGNLIVNVLEPRAGDELLQSDLDVRLSRWRGPAGIWVASPDNTVQDNVVVNAGTGYWHPYVHKLKCYDDPSDPEGSLNPLYGRHCNHVDRSENNPNEWNVEPVRTATRVYKDNIAIATRVGHTWDGAPDGVQVGTGNEFNRDLVVTGYAPATQQTFEGMHAYRSGRTGVYYRGSANTALIKNAVVAEAPIGWFGTGDQDFFDSVFVGISEAYQGSDPSDEDFYYHVDPDIPDVDRGSPNHLFHGWGLYDGGNHFKNVSFDYPVAPMYLGGKEITPVPISIFGRGHFANHVLEQLHFVNDPYRRINLDAQNFSVNWKDVEGSESIYDIDGSLFGNPGFIRPDIAFNDLSGDCVKEVNNADADPSTLPSTVLRCAGETQSIKFQMASTGGTTTATANYQEFTAQRTDNTASVSNPGPGVLFDKFLAYSDTSPAVNYRIEDLNFKSGPTYDDDHSGSLVWIETFEMGDWTPLIIIDGNTATNLASSCEWPSDYELKVWPSAPSGLIYRATTLTEFRDFNDPNYDGTYYQHTPSGSLALKLRGTESLAGNPNVFQHEAQGRFDLVCPVPEPGFLVMLAAGLGLLQGLSNRRARLALR